MFSMLGCAVLRAASVASAASAATFAATFVVALNAKSVLPVLLVAVGRSGLFVGVAVAVV